VPDESRAGELVKTVADYLDLAIVDGADTRSLKIAARLLRDALVRLGRDEDGPLALDPLGRQLKEGSLDHRDPAVVDLVARAVEYELEAVKPPRR
jgi:hypothetical protein